MSGFKAILDLKAHHHALTYCKFDSFKERAQISDNWRTVRSTVKALRLNKLTKESVCGRRFPTLTFKKFSEFQRTWTTPRKGVSVGVIETIALADQANSITTSWCRVQSRYQFIEPDPQS